ncbi:hypothetical protein [Streptomyces alboflavus]|uniref:hypothetical protein n=1 Tax=Streptomyces alboflavus TaxID=67267 RepID=UPI0036B66268
MSGTLTLGSKGLTKAVQCALDVREWLIAARDADPPAVTSPAVLAEVIHPKIRDRH